VQIAQVAPLREEVPPRFYGGTERVVSYLTGNLVQLGHDVPLFASGDSETRGRLAGRRDHGAPLARGRHGISAVFRVGAPPVSDTASGE
jgi:hypothetical protein